MNKAACVSCHSSVLRSEIPTLRVSQEGAPMSFTKSHGVLIQCSGQSQASCGTPAS